MKFAALKQKGFHQDATIITAEKVLEMATIGGARAVGLEEEIGSVEVGKKADMVVLDYEQRVHDADSSSGLGDCLLGVGA